MFKLRSVKSIVVVPPSTGRESKSNTAVIKTAQTKNDLRSIVIPEGRILITVVLKFTAPKIDETPAKCKENIPVSTEAPA